VNGSETPRLPVKMLETSIIGSISPNPSGFMLAKQQGL
jgi:hypothetical protein